MVQIAKFTIRVCHYRKTKPNLVFEVMTKIKSCCWIVKVAYNTSGLPSNSSDFRNITVIGTSSGA